MSTTLSFEQLCEKVQAILEHAGLNKAQAQAVATVIAKGERDACKAHGVYRIEGVLRTFKAGKVRGDAIPTIAAADDSAIIRIDGQSGFSLPAFDLGLPLLVEKARQLGLAAMVINDCTHFSALWPEVEAITDQGLAAMVMCPSYATVAPWGGTKPLFGTNPFAFGWPRQHAEPYVFDFATSVAARGEIELYRRDGKQLPQGWAIDDQGQPTTAPDAALAGAMLPFGGYKGSAMSTMIELLAGVMIGDLTSTGALDALGTTAFSPAHGELIIAMSPERFSDCRPGDPFARAEILFEAIEGQGARLPSQRRFAARRTAQAQGIVLTDAEMQQLDRLLDLGLEAID
ncbi:MAG: Ldh family oxidoreductase [Candidatus Devosia phytovorans]|uniref:Ldh family oxidoreductase n=1 Tax=Candidatus Devosia phytovorans TaxID=3121372 RepID=A0AAJ5VTL7_9HYPH|nr:Ldh family oxidoreductase [Devosia sp.]WEK03377.1 MAG: Ldh family oxidoreductase [Devosia sp.]